MAKRYNTEEIERGLHALALEAGNTHAASRLCGIPQQTLSQWRLGAYRDKYERLRRQLEDRLDRDLAEDMARLTRQRLEAAEKLGQRIHDNVDGDDEKLKNLANADHNLVKSLGLLTNSNRTIRDKPTVIVEQRNADQLIQKLQHAGIIEGTATEVQPAELEAAQSV